MTRAEILERLTNLDEVIDYTEKRIECNANEYNKLANLALWNNAERLQK